MKIRKIQLKKYSLIQLYLLKYQTYQNFKNKKFNFIYHIEQIKLYLKHSFYIISQYHNNNKIILFVGLPNKIQLKAYNVFKMSNHYFISENIWINGLLSNRISIFRNLNLKGEKKRFILNLLEIKTSPNLIVLFNPSKESKLILESYNLDIPIISIGDVNSRNSFFTFKIPGSFLKIKMKIFCQFLIYSLLKKSKMNLKNSLSITEK